MPSMYSGPSSPQDETSNVRLDSWKEIAAYLGRGERTAKRWETERALPVHRLPGGGRGSVYAFSAELDEWLRSAKPDETTNPAEANASSESTQDFAAVDATVSPPTAEVLPGDTLLPGATPSGRMQGASWRIPLIVFLPIVLTAVFLFSLRTTRQHPSPNLHQQPTRPAPVSSDSEKQIAHDLYLRGRFEWNKRTPDSLNRALDDFTQAVVHDPANAQAYVGLADTYNLLREDSLMPGNDAFQRAIVASKKAVELDNSLGEAHRSLAFDELWGNWNFQAGETEFRLAMELNPRDPLAHLWFANAFQGPGWYAICMREINRAQELDPASPVVLAGKGQLLINMGQSEQGIEMLKQVERTDPDFPAPHRYLANQYFALRKYPDFLIESQKQAELTGDPVLEAITAAAREGLSRGGERGLLESLYTMQHKYYTAGKFAGPYLARTCVRMGKKDEALQLLRADYANHTPEFLIIRADLVLAELKDEPAYWALLKNLHVPSPESDAAESPRNQDAGNPEPKTR